MTGIEYLIEKLKIKGIETPNNINKTTILHREYFKNLDTFGDKIVELSNIRKNLHCMSGRFYPRVLYLTPQCGEYENHQILLDKFAEINRSYIQTEEDENK